MAGGYLLQSAVSATGNGNAVNLRGRPLKVKVIVTASGTVSSGGVTVEEAHASDYSGTWDSLTTEITPTSNAAVGYTFDGPLNFVRARISTTIAGGGTVTVRLQELNDTE